jgi:riboflavin transporter FmnP
VTWFIAYFLMGFKPSFTTALIVGLIITLFVPDVFPGLGAIMKLLATVPVLLTMFIYNKLYQSKPSKFRSFRFVILPLIAGIILRLIIIIPTNYLIAIPLWTKMSTIQAWSTIPWPLIAVFNIIQTFLDVIIAWLIVYRFRIEKFSDYNE